VLDYMRKGELPNFRYRQGRPQFNASSSIPKSVPLHIQLKEFMDEQAKINKDTVTKFSSFNVGDLVLRRIQNTEGLHKLSSPLGRSLHSRKGDQAGLLPLPDT
jgi:hypothetical protein